MSVFYIRADMNKVIATGHVMRTLSIADAMKSQGAKVVYITADHEADELLKRRGFEQIVLESDWQNKEAELPLLLDILKDDRPGLLIDSYEVTKTYLSELSKHANVSYIDDLNAFIYPVDRVICYANYAHKFDYEKRYGNAGQNTSFLLGTDFAPLRSEFLDCPKKTINNSIDNLLYMMGL